MISVLTRRNRYNDNRGVMIRRTVLFSGRVQGVGFRHTTYTLARDFDVTGYVKNLPDRRVELVVEGGSDEVDRFIAELRQEMTDYINGEDSHESPAAGQFDRFEIRF